MTALATPDPLVGRLLDGRYRLGAKLGEGGMGTVYRGTHMLMNRPCAIKVLRGPAPVVRLAGKRFQREAQSASRLDHDHCIRVTDFGITPDDLMYLVMELLEGRSLAEELAAGGSLHLPRVLHIARQIAAALAHAHALGIVHRDLKPDNVFLVNRGGDPDFVKVLDFGLAKILDDRTGGRHSTLSEAGTVFGTPEYMAPEQAEGKPLDARADLYSFGVVLYHMMTGQLPFQGANIAAILSQHLTQNPVSPSTRRPDLELPPALVTLCLRCLEKDPARRPAAATEVLAGLEAIEAADAPAPVRVPVQVAVHPTVDVDAAPAAASLPQSPAAVERPPETPSPLGPTAELSDDDLRPPRNRAGIYALVLAPVLLGAGIGVLLLFRPAGPPEAGVASDPSVAGAPAPGPPALAPSPSAVEAAPAPTEAAPTVPPSPTTTARPSAPTAASHLREADAYAEKGNRIKELFHLQQAVRLEPGNTVALYRLGRALLEDGQADLGCDKLARAIQLGSKPSESLYDSSGCAARAPH